MPRRRDRHIDAKSICFDAVRTTIRIDDALLADAKAYAARTGRTLTAVIEEALRETLARARSRRRQPVELPVSPNGGGTLPGVDLSDSAALLDLMESDDRPV
jgi:hypothetical protein